MAVRDIAGVVNIENDAGRRAFVRRHPLIDERVGQADRVFQRRRILHPRQRRLRAQIAARLGQAAGRRGSMPDRFAKSRDRRRPRSRRRWRGCAPGSCQHGYEGRVWDRDGRESSAPADPRRQADARPSPTASRRHLRSGVRRQKRRRLSCPGWLETRTAGDYHWSWRAGPWRGDDQDRCRQPNPTLYQRFTLRSPA